MKPLLLSLALILLGSVGYSQNSIYFTQTDTIKAKGLASHEIIKLAEKVLATKFPDFRAGLQYIDEKTIIVRHGLMVPGMRGVGLRASMPYDEPYTYLLKVNVTPDFCILTADEYRYPRGNVSTRQTAERVAADYRNKTLREYFLKQTNTIYTHLELDFQRVSTELAVEIYTEAKRREKPSNAATIQRISQPAKVD